MQKKRQIKKEPGVVRGGASARVSMWVERTENNAILKKIK